MNCAKREPGRSWESIDSELKKLGEHQAEHATSNLTEQAGWQDSNPVVAVNEEASLHTWLLVPWAGARCAGKLAVGARKAFCAVDMDSPMHSRVSLWPHLNHDAWPSPPVAAHAAVLALRLRADRLLAWCCRALPKLVAAAPDQQRPRSGQGQCCKAAKSPCSHCAWAGSSARAPVAAACPAAAACGACPCPASGGHSAGQWPPALSCRVWATLTRPAAVSEASSSVHNLPLPTDAQTRCRSSAPGPAQHLLQHLLWLPLHQQSWRLHERAVEAVL